MEINITQFYNDANPATYSASVAELGENAGRITWDNAMGAPVLLDTTDKLEAMRAWARASGAWSDVELAAWLCMVIVINRYAGLIWAVFYGRKITARRKVFNNAVFSQGARCRNGTEDAQMITAGYNKLQARAARYFWHPAKFARLTNMLMARGMTC